MNQERDFLTALAHALAIMSLYDSGHPSRERAIEAAYEMLTRLQEAHESCSFTFLDDEVLFGEGRLMELRRWDWSRRLGEAGIQRLEFLGPVTQEDFDAFLQEAYDRLAGEVIDSASVRQGRPSRIRYGPLMLRGESDDPGSTGEDELVTATVAFDLNDEFQAIDWLHEELRDRSALHMLEAETLVRSLSVAMHGDQSFLIPLVRLKEFDQYTTTHALNVSVLAMALAEFVGHSPAEVRTFGIAGLLHDLGKVTIPDEVLNKPGKLTEEERAIMNGHPAAGARLILEAEDELDVAAVVAYEHHIKIDGGGYPHLRYARPCHRASDMVHVCDVFDALRTHRPYREAWAQDRVLTYIEEGAGTEFESGLARAFVRMIRHWSDRIATVEDPSDPLPIGDGLGDARR